MNRATWGWGPSDYDKNLTGFGPVGEGVRAAVCWSCEARVATLTRGEYRTTPGFRNRATRHPGADLPWYGPSPKALARAVGRHPREPAPSYVVVIIGQRSMPANSSERFPYVRFLGSGLTMRPPVDNLVDVPGPSEYPSD
jgi:hypothetical protein